MTWEIEYTDEFENWWNIISEKEQNDIVPFVNLLREKGSLLSFPYSSGIVGSSYPHMRELRIQSSGKPIRIFYAFDPRRTAILLIGGNKTGDDLFYKKYIPIADKLYNIYLKELKKEGLI